jgi:hypothetical protein
MCKTKLLWILTGTFWAVYGFDVKPAVQKASAVNSVDAPSLGYAVSPAGPQLRVILGVPGSARFSDPIPLPDTALAVDLPPGQRWALVTTDADLLVFNPATGQATPLASGVPDSYAFSPSGKRLGIYLKTAGKIAIYKGLPDSPILESTTEIGSFDSLAVGDAAGFVYSSAGRVYFNPGNDADQFLYESASLGPVVFESGASAIVLFDGANASLVEVAVSGGSTRIVATGFGAPDRLFAWTDRVAAGSSSQGTLWMIDSATGTIAMPQSVPVSRIVPTQLAGTFLLSFDDGQPAWLSGPEGVSFVPAMQPSVQ